MWSVIFTKVQYRTTNHMVCKNCWKPAKPFLSKEKKDVLNFFFLSFIIWILSFFFQEGLCVCTSLDQSLRVIIVTKLKSVWYTYWDIYRVYIIIICLYIVNIVAVFIWTLFFNSDRPHHHFLVICTVLSELAAASSHANKDVLMKSCLTTYLNANQGFIGEFCNKAVFQWCNKLKTRKSCNDFNQCSNNLKLSISSGFWKNSLYYNNLLLLVFYPVFPFIVCVFVGLLTFLVTSFLFLVLFCTLNRPRNSQSAEEPKETIKIHEGHQETIDIVFQINSYSKSNLKQQIKWHNTVFIPYLFGILDHI